MQRFVAAPKLTTAVKKADSVAAGWFKISKRWQARAEKIEVVHNVSSIRNLVMIYLYMTPRTEYISSAS